MSWQRADHRDRELPRADSYGRQAYQLPPTVLQREVPPPFVDPLESVQRPHGYPERDSGWGNRRARNASSQVEPVQGSRHTAERSRDERDHAAPTRTEHPRYTAGQSGNGRGYAAPLTQDPRRTVDRTVVPYDLDVRQDPRRTADPYDNDLHWRQDPRRDSASYDLYERHDSRNTTSTPQDPRHAMRPWTSDARARPFASPSPAPSVTPALEVPYIERKLEYLLRTIEGRLHRELAERHARWTGSDTRLLRQALEEHQRHQDQQHQGTLRMRTMRTALAHYRILLQCQAEQRADPVERFEELRNTLQNLVFDICEELDVSDRVEGYRALLDLCKRDVTLVKSNVSALVQVLENDGDYGRERVVIYEVLFRHLELAKEVDQDDPLTDCLRLMFPRKLKQEVRGVVISFFDSQWGDQVIDMIFGDIWHEAVLAICLADAMLLAVEADIPMLIELLQKLQSIWIGPDEVITEGEKVAALHAAVTVLWTLGRVLMAKAGVFDEAGVILLPSGEEDSAGASVLSPSLTRLLNRFDVSSKEPNIEDGVKTFSYLRSAIDLLIVKRPEREDEAALQNLSETRKFLDELALSTRYPFCFLPVDTTQPETVLNHFDATQRIVLFRSMANLAAQVASAEEKRPQELAFAFDGDRTAADLAKAAARALMEHVPTSRETFRKLNEGSPSDAFHEAFDAYTMLAAEALLTTIHRCESCMTDAKAGPTTFSTGKNRSEMRNESARRDRLSSLISLAEDIVTAQKALPEVLEAAKVVVCLGKELLGKRWSNEAKLAPTWLMEPPPFPEWEGPQAVMPRGPRSDSPAKPSGSRKGGRKRKGSRDDQDQSEERRVRGRGAVHAFMDDFDPSKPAATGSNQIGIAIRGRAEHRSPNFMPADVYRPKRRAAESAAESSTSVSGERNGAREKAEEANGGGRVTSEDSGVWIKTEEQGSVSFRAQSGGRQRVGRDEEKQRNGNDYGDWDTCGWE